jgi:hypothetical protein
MTKVIIGFWPIGLGFALGHLLFLTGYEISVGLVAALAVALACYSLPFFLLILLRPPPGHRLKAALATGVAACVIAINLYIPLRRFLPGYHPEPLEALIYLAAPLAECVPIAIALVIL